MRVDCERRCGSRAEAELERYMDGSAATSGRIMAPLLGAPPGQHEDVARLGAAFQLTNFIRDVREDWAMGRVYLPGLPDGRPRRAADRRARRAARARRAPGRPRPRAVRRDAGGGRGRAPAVRPGMRIAVAVYVRVLDRVERIDYDVLGALAGAARRGRPRGPSLAAGCRAMTVRATQRGAERTSLDGERADVLVCGASFAGLAVARELAGGGADVLVVDRYEIGERQTSACAARRRGCTRWASQARSARSCPYMTFTTPHGPRATGCRGAGRRSTTASCATCCGRSAATRASRPRRSTAARGDGADRRAHRPRRPAARRSSSTRSAGAACSREPALPAARGAALARARGPPAHDAGGDALDLWIERGARAPRLRLARARRRRGARRRAAPTTRATASGSRRGDSPQRSSVDAVGYQGNWFPHRLRAAAEDGVFFVGDSAGHCFPLSGEGIRTAFYFGIAAGASCAPCSRASAPRERALARYARVPRRATARVRCALRLQRLIPALPPRGC